MKSYDALIIGAGPAGTTVATFLARAGRRVAMIEQEAFPRFKIGESLLPASTPIFQRLGVLERLKERFIVKPGGKWFVGPGAWRGDFSLSLPEASFAQLPFAFMAERSHLDQVLLQNALDHGAELIQPARVVQVLEQGDRVVGLELKTSDGNQTNLTAKMVFDCSGRAAILGRHFKMMRQTTLNRVAFYAHYRAEPLDADLKAGWFVGQMVNDGWIWAIPLERGKISIGIVINQDLFKKSGLEPKSFFERNLEESGFMARVLEPGYENLSKVWSTPDIGYSCERLVGPGWVTVGDAGFFVDPCFSSGVHLALYSAEMAAQCFLKSDSSEPIDPLHFANYQRALRVEERNVTLMVKHFYNVSRFPRLQRISGQMSDSRKQINFNTFVGGDFTLEPDFAEKTYESVASLIDAPL